MSHLVRLIFSAMLACHGHAGAAQERPSIDTLRPLTNCAFGGGLKAEQVERWSGDQPWRSVQTASGALQVSLADGYRMQLAFPGGAPFVNLRLERSQPGKLGQDRSAILAQMSDFAARPGAAVAPLRVVARNGVEIIALNQRKLEGNVVGIYTLISEKSDIVATAYLHNGTPARRQFKKLAQYHGARDDFIYALALCMAEL